MPIVAFDLTDKEAAYFDGLSKQNGTSRKFEVARLVSETVAKKAAKKTTKKIPKRR